MRSARHARAALAVCCLVGVACQGEPVDESSVVPEESRVQVAEGSDPQAIEIAQRSVEAMGGWEAWDATRFLSWHFFGRRLHYWDRATGDVRIEGPFRVGDENVELTVLMNVDTRRGRVWREGTEITDPEALEGLLELGRQAWVNDSYWVIMPFKLLDPGVVLKAGGERELEDGRMADVLELTFADGVGYTPQNRYEVFVARDTSLVEQWSFFAEASDESPRFTYPWTGWQRFGRVKIATVHQPPQPDKPAPDWEIAVHETLPRSVFESPAPVSP